MNTRYDIPNGVLSANAGVSGDGYGYAEVTMQDDFTVYGLPAGTSVVLAAHFNVRISSNSLGYPKGDGTLREAFGDSVTAFLPGVTDLRIDVSAVAGQPFRLSYELSARGDYMGGGSVSGLISFSGVPSGAAVLSCNGYVSDRTVAVRSASWARLKSIYR